MTIKESFRKAGVITLAGLVGYMPLMAKENTVSSEQQSKYGELQKGRLDRQVLKYGSTYPEDNEINAAFIDGFVGNNDWMTTAKERDDFLEQSEGNDIFYVVVESVKPNASPDSTFACTNNPLDYICSVTKRNVFSTREGAEREINKRLKEREFAMKAGMHVDRSGNDEIGYVQARNHKSENKPYTVTSFFRLDGDNFVEQDVLGYALSENGVRQ